MAFGVASDNMDSETRRRPSQLLPKPDITLPNLVDSVPFHTGGAQSQTPNQPAGIPALFVPGVTEVLYNGNPLVQYKICGQVYTMEKPANESRSEMRRCTLGGRKLKYLLDVIQEPARARACGAGPRSSADRRPVDPPPVVQLNVIDEGTNEDITMWYDAGFMLYASLEIARPIAQGRMHQSQNPAVLSGVAVASAAYLQRPNEAGYFIFPDLSVRHEGWYRLKFSLFEAVKHAADAEIDRPFVALPDQNIKDANTDVVSHQSMSNRMEVQSSPFQVFSAKKFPGLDPSTNISKIVAEQGCRVRIRREIRQRKRNPDDKLEDDRRSSRTSPAPSFTPSEHIRSVSRSSIDYYDRMRHDSMEYPRPTPSRQPSIASMTQPSPTVASSSHMTPMGPPPPFKYEMSPMYSPVTRATDLRYITSQTTLPPMLPKPPGMGSVPFNPADRRYELPEKSTVKRSYSPASYDDRAALKAGARPDNRPYAPFHRTTGVNDVIEPDDNQEGDEEEVNLFDKPFEYVRADGYLSRKNDPRDRRMWSNFGRV